MDIELQQKEFIGKVIRDRRKSRQIMQEDLAEIAGISPRTLRNIEKGQGNPELDTLTRICNVLGLALKLEIIK